MWEYCRILHVFSCICYNQILCNLAFSVSSGYNRKRVKGKTGCSTYTADSVRGKHIHMHTSPRQLISSKIRRQIAKSKVAEDILFNFKKYVDSIKLSALRILT